MYGIGWGHRDWAPPAPAALSPARTEPDAFIIYPHSQALAYWHVQCWINSAGFGPVAVKQTRLCISGTWASLFDRWWKSCIVCWAAVKKLSFVAEPQRRKFVSCQWRWPQKQNSTNKLKLRLFFFSVLQVNEDIEAKIKLQVKVA